MLNLHLPRPALAGLTVLALALSACGGASGSVAPSAAPASAAAPSAPAATSGTSAGGAATGRVELPDKGFAVTLPDGWESLPLDPTQLQQVIDTLPADSQLSQLLQSQAGSAALKALAMWAFDVSPNSPAGVNRNMNVIAQPPSSFDLSQMESAVKAQLGTLQGVGQIDSEIVTLPAGDALKLSYSLATPGSTATGVATTQYYVQLPKSTLIVSFTSEPGATDAAADFDSIMQSLEPIS